MAGKTYGLEPVDYDPFAENYVAPEKTYGLEAVDYDPFAKEDEAPGRLTTAVSNFGRGATSVASGLPKALAIQNAQYAQDIMTSYDKIDAGEDALSIADIASGKTFGNELKIQRYKKASPEDRLKMRAEAIEGQRPEDSSLYKAGKWLDNVVADALPVNEKYKDEFWTTKVPQGLGSMAGFMASGVAGRVAGAGGTATTAVSGMALGSVEGFEDAVKKGATLEEAYKSANMNGFVGASEAIPISNMLKRLNDATGGGIEKAIKEAVVEGTEEAIQEAFQSIMGNVVANNKDLGVGYDEKRGTFTGTVEGAEVGFTVGAIVGFISSLVYGRKKSSHNAPPPVTDAPTVQEQARENAGNLSQSDLDSVQDNDLLRGGRQALAEVEAVQASNEILSRNELPTLDTEVAIDFGTDDNTGKADVKTGKVTGAFSLTNPETGEAEDGIEITLEDGSKFRNIKSLLDAANVVIAPIDGRAVEVDAFTEAANALEEQPSPDTAPTPEIPTEQANLPSDALPDANIETPSTETASDVVSEIASMFDMTAEELIADYQAGGEVSEQVREGLAENEGVDLDELMTQNGVESAPADEFVEEPPAPSYHTPGYGNSKIQKTILGNAGKVLSKTFGDRVTVTNGQLHIKSGTAAENRIAAEEMQRQTDMAINRSQSAKERGGPKQKDRGILGWIAKRGGIVDDGGELKSRDLDLWHKGKPGVGKVIREKTDTAQSSIDGSVIGNPDADNSWERSFESAVDNGFFPELDGLDVRDYDAREMMLDLIDAEQLAEANGNVSTEEAAQDAANDEFDSKFDSPEERADFEAMVAALEAKEEADYDIYVNRYSEPISTGETLTQEDRDKIDAEIENDDAGAAEVGSGQQISAEGAALESENSSEQNEENEPATRTPTETARTLHPSGEPFKTKLGAQRWGRKNGMPNGQVDQPFEAIEITGGWALQPTDNSVGIFNDLEQTPKNKTKKARQDSVKFKDLTGVDVSELTDNSPPQKTVLELKKTSEQSLSTWTAERAKRPATGEAVAYFRERIAEEEASIEKSQKGIDARKKRIAEARENPARFGLDLKAIEEGIAEFEAEIKALEEGRQNGKSNIVVGGMAVPRDRIAKMEAAIADPRLAAVQNAVKPLIDGYNELAAATDGDYGMAHVVAARYLHIINHGERAYTELLNTKFNSERLAKAQEEAGLSKPTTETVDTADGKKEQTVIKGAEQDKGGANQRRADAPLKPDAEQKGMDGTDLFDPDSVDSTGDIFDAPAPAPKSNYGKSNKIVKEDAAEAARKILRDAAKGGQFNVGLDPKIVQAGITLTAYHIEAGARSFADFTKAMTDDMGGFVAPYLRSWYEAVRYDPNYDNNGMTPATEIDNVSSPSESVESNSEESNAENSVGQEDVQSGSGVSNQGAGSGSGTNSVNGSGQSSSGDLLADDAPSVGEGGNSGVLNDQPTDDVGASQSGNSGGSRSDGNSGSTTGSSGTENTSTPTETNPDVDQTIPQDIRDALPLLHPAQQRDVMFAEERFAQPDGHGVMFTNGTGTGKTYTGAGIVKRFVDAGKGNILILVPGSGVADQWEVDGGKNGVKITKLKDTKDSGSGVVITTYANFRANHRLAGREWDLIVTDESQNILEAKAGDEKGGLKYFRGITNHPKRLRQKARMLEFELLDEINIIEGKKNSAENAAKAFNSGNKERIDKALKSLDKEFGGWSAGVSVAAAKAQAEEMKLLLNPLEVEMKRRVDARMPAVQQLPRGKVVFLSATPFGYDKTVDYAEGYLFEYGPEPASNGYNTPDAQQAFMIRHFGYRMRTGKLTRPEAEVENDIMEVAFHEGLRDRKVLSGRVLDVPFDYDRKFVLIDDGIGNKIDELMEFLRDGEDGKFKELAKLVEKKFDYLSRMRLLEAIKAHHAIDAIKKHHELGRKVIVFHDYNVGGGISPFELNEIEMTMEFGVGGETVKMRDLHRAFVKAKPEVLKMDFSEMKSPIETLSAAFPNVDVYNGKKSDKHKADVKRRFNLDDNGINDAINLVVIQAEAGKAGISLHDTTGNHQRVIINIGMPPRATTTIQQEGRIYRIGQASDAIFRYMNTGTSWERQTFADSIAARAGTAENLALGNQARSLRQSIIDAFIESDVYDPSVEDGKGGKELDKASGEGHSLFQKAKTFYFGQQKNNKKRDQREGAEYYATPEPIGLKMVEFADIKAGDDVLEPSVGHGAIARYFPNTVNKTIIDDSAELMSRAALAVPGANKRTERFEDLHISNKYDAIVMNPPYGQGSKTALEHIEKAAKHLRNGGRIVALIPEGGMATKRLEQFMESDAAKDLYLVGDISLPSVTFKRVGTGVNTHIIVLEKHTDDEVVQKLEQNNRDYSSAEDIKELFDRIENAEIRPRLEPLVAEEKTTPIEEAAEADPDYVPLGFKTENKEHTKTGETLYLAKAERNIDAYQDVKSIVKRHGGFWDKWSKAFRFKSNEDRMGFLQEIGIGQAQEGRKFNIRREVKEKMPRIKQSLRARLKELGLADKIALNLVDQIESIIEGKASNIDGSYINKLIEVSMSSPDSSWVLNHEVIHALKDLGVIRELELKTLEKAALADKARMAEIKERYSDLSESEQVEEAIADMFADYVASKTQTGGALKRAFDRAIKFIKALYRSFKTQGFTTADQIFEAIDVGVVGRRAMGESIASKILNSRRRDSEQSDMGEPFRGNEAEESQPEERERPSNQMGLLAASFDSPSNSLAEHLDNSAQGKVARLKAAANYLSDKARQKMQDKYIWLRRTQEAIEQSRKTAIDEDQNSYVLEELFHGKTAQKMRDLSEKVVEPLIKKVRDMGLTLENVNDYLYARHAKERNEQIRKIDPNSDGAGSGWSDAKADEVMSDFSAEQIANLESVATDVDHIIALSLRRRIDAGLLSKQAAKQWLSTYRYYVPLRGFADETLGADHVDANNRVHTGKGFSIKGTESKRALGRESEAGNILANVLMNADEAIVRSEKNIVAKSFFKMVQANPNDDFWEVSDVEYKKSINPSTGLVELRAIRYDSDSDGTIFVKVDGNQHRIKVHHKGLASSMKNLGAESMNGIVRGLQIFNRYLSLVNTSWNPEFILTNLSRDVQTAMINLSKEDTASMRLQIGKDIIPALRGAWGGIRGEESSEWQKWYQEFARAGGKTDMIGIEDADVKARNLERKLAELDPTKSVKVKMAVAAARDVIDDANSAVENAVRLATYANARRAGISKQKAASLAKNLTVNFNRKGEWATGMGAIYLFYNASVQGTFVLLGAMKSKKVQKVAMGMVAMGAALEILNVLSASDNGDDEDEYDKMSEHNKAHNLVFPNPFAGPDSSTPNFKLPMPYGYNIFPTIGRKVVEVARSKINIETGKPMTAMDAAGDIISTALGSFNPIGSGHDLTSTLMPTFAQPLHEISRNMNFMGSPITPPQNPYAAKKPESKSHFKSVSAISKAAANALAEYTHNMKGGSEFINGGIEVSPEILDHVASFFTGGAGTTLGRIVDLPAKLMSGNAKWNDIPIVRRFVGSQNEYYDRTRYYQTRDPMMQVEKAYKAALANEDIAKGKATISELKKEYAPEMAVMDNFKATEKLLKALNKGKKYANEDEKKLIDQYKKEAARKFNADYSKAVKASK